MSYAAQNMHYLKEKYNHTYNMLQNYPNNDRLYQQIIMQDGLKNIIFPTSTGTELYLYERQNTVLSLALWMQSIAEMLSKYDHILLYGLGLGYHLKLLLEHYPNKWIYVYEPDADMFMTALATEDFSSLLSHPNVKAVGVGQTIEEKRQVIYPICNLAQGSCAFITIPFYEQRNPEELNRFREEFPVTVSEYNVNQSTLIRFKDDWMHNRLNHLATNLNSYSITGFKDRLAEIPALIVGSGPSLQQDIETVRKLKSHCLVIAAGSSLQALLHHEITPHIVVVVDGGPVVENIFQASESLQIPIVYTSTSNYKVTDKTQASRIHVFDDTDRVTCYFMGEDEREPVFRSLASVSGMAVQVAAYLGCTTIALAGQDFSFPEDRHYAEGVAHIGEQQRQATVQSADIYVDNVKGGQNRITLPYKVLQRNMEEVISWYPNIHFINTSKIGASIAGTEWLAAEQLYEQWQQGSVVQQDWFEKEIVHNAAGYGSERMEHTTAKLASVPGKLERIQQTLRGIIRQLSRLAELSRKNPQKCLNSMRVIERDWSSIVDEEVFNILFEPLLPAELQFFDSHLSLIIEEQNIIKKAKYFETYLGKIVQEISKTVPKLEGLYREAKERINGGNSG